VLTRCIDQVRLFSGGVDRWRAVSQMT